MHMVVTVTRPQLALVKVDTDTVEEAIKVAHSYMNDDGPPSEAVVDFEKVTELPGWEACQVDGLNADGSHAGTLAEMVVVSAEDGWKLQVRGDR